jgi:Leucine-rich repeat (LRR) protein
VPAILNLNVETINLAHNVITSLADDSFPAEMPQLYYLDLHDNVLTVIQANTFSKLTLLTTLYLSENLLTEVKAGLFDALCSLWGSHSKGCISLPHAFYWFELSSSQHTFDPTDMSVGYLL